MRDHHLHVAPLRGEARAPGDSWERRRAEYEKWLADERSFVVVAVAGGEDIGYAFVRVIPGHSETWQAVAELAELETIIVLPAFQDRGVGRALLDFVVAEVRRLGLSELALSVIAGNEPAIAFYTRYGFAPQEIIMKLKVGPA